MRRAVVIRTVAVGDPEISRAIVDGMRPSVDELEALKARLKTMEDRQARYEVSMAVKRDYWYGMCVEAQYYYGDNPHYGRVASAMLGVIGLACELVACAYRHLSEWNRRA